MYKRLTTIDRMEIQAGIIAKTPISKICKVIKKSRSTVFREIKRNSKINRSRKSCSSCAKNCKNRREKYRGAECTEHIAKLCPKLTKFPFVCNKCPNYATCPLEKRYYDYMLANSKAKEKLVNPRKKSKFSDETIKKIDEIVSIRISNGQGIHHIFVSSNKLQSICSESTVRRMVVNHKLSASPSDLPRYVRFNRSLKKPEPVDINKAVNIANKFNRTFDRYLEYTKTFCNLNCFQYDSVVGSLKDRKAILTITHTETNFQFGFMIDRGNPEFVIKIMKSLKEKLGDEFYDIFEVNLSDNGTEFNHLWNIEFDENGVQRCRCFYTRPYTACDKSECERNHEFIRYILPKGVSLDRLTQEDVNLIFSHINSYIRKCLGNKTPYEVFIKKFGCNLVNAIGIASINPEDVILKPKLLRK